MLGMFTVWITFSVVVAWPSTIAPGQCFFYTFWLSCAPERVCGGANFFGSALLQPARSVCVASERFFSLFCDIFGNLCRPRSFALLVTVI